MFEPKFSTILDNMSDEEKRIALHIRNKQIISQVLVMTDDDFIRFKEVIMKEIEKYSTLFDDIFTGNDSFNYNEYHKNLKELRSLCGSYVEFIKIMYNEFFKPFIECKFNVIKSLESPSSYLKHLSSDLDDELIGCERLISLSNEILEHLKTYKNFKLKDGIDYSTLYKNISSFDEKNNLDIFESVDIEKVKEICSNYDDEMYNLKAKDYPINSLIFEIERINYHIECNYKMFIGKESIEHFARIYNKLELFSSKICEHIDNSELRSQYKNICCLGDNELKIKKVICNFYTSENYSRLMEYLKLLNDEQKKYHDSQKSEIQDKFISSIEPFILHSEFMASYDKNRLLDSLDTFDSFRDLVIRNYKKQKVYRFLAPYVVDESELLGSLDYICSRIYSYMANIAQDGNYSVNPKLFDAYVSVKKKMDCVHSVDEEEIISATMNPVLQKIKKL